MISLPFTMQDKKHCKPCVFTQGFFVQRRSYERTWDVFWQNEFYQIIRNVGDVWNDSKERPIICLMKSLERDDLYWAIPVGNYEHRNDIQKARIQKYMNYNIKDIRSCFYHVGNTNEKSIFFISDAVPITDKYIEREYKNKTKKYTLLKIKFY